VPHPLQLRVRVLCSEQGVDERAIRPSLQKVKTRTLEHRKGAAPNFTKISVLNDRLVIRLNADAAQLNKLNRMMHHSVEIPSRQVIFLPSA
jgi:hypothetical protein